MSDVKSTEENGSIVYPNPNNGTFYITGTPGSTYTIYDYSGRLMLSSKITESQTEINSALSKGVYFVRFSETGKLTKVVVK
jgi:hypothetical protein